MAAVREVVNLRYENPELKGEVVRRLLLLAALPVAFMLVLRLSTCGSAFCAVRDGRWDVARDRRLGARVRELYRRSSLFRGI